MKIELIFEKLLFSLRWLLAPVYLGMSVGLIAIAVRFYHEVFSLITLAPHDYHFVLILLDSVDLSLLGGLIVMIMLSGYENFVSRIAASENELPEWLGKMGPNSLKLKVAAAIVAISSIHLLQIFMNANEISNDKLMWFVIMHLTFVFSAFLMGLLDKITHH